MSRLGAWAQANLGCSTPAGSSLAIRGKAHGPCRNLRQAIRWGIVMDRQYLQGTVPAVALLPLCLFLRF